MAGYPYLLRVSDANTRNALKALFDLLQQLQTRIDALEATQTARTTSLDANGNRIVNIATPQADTDAVNLATLRSYVAAQLEAFK